MRDYYSILGVPRTATAAEIKTKFRELAMRDHPDRKPGDRAAEERMKAYGEAWMILGDPAKKAKYDRELSSGRDWTDRDMGVGNMSWEEIFSAVGDLFGKPVNFGGRVRSQRGQDVHVPMTLSFVEACRGVAKEIRLRRELGSRIEDEVMSVKIPAGALSGTTCRIVGKGTAGSFGGPAGNLYVDLTVAPDERFRRDGLDIHVTAAVTFPALVLGGSVVFEGLDGARMVRVPAGQVLAEPIRLRGEGVPAINGRGVGDLIVHLELEVARASRAAAEALRAYAVITKDPCVIQDRARASR
jgi:curved DNA-binding protein